MKKPYSVIDSFNIFGIELYNRGIWYHLNTLLANELNNNKHVIEIHIKNVATEDCIWIIKDKRNETNI